MPGCGLRSSSRSATSHVRLVSNLPGGRRVRLNFGEFRGQFTYQSLAVTHLGQISNLSPKIRGNVGSAIGAGWVKAGHDVMFSSRDIRHDEALAARLGMGARAGTPREVALFRDLAPVGNAAKALDALRQIPRGRADSIGKREA